MDRIRSSRAFTLVELLAVVIILGILMAILIPTFLNSRDDAQDQSAATELVTAYHRAKAYWVDKEKYPVQGTLVSRLQSDEPGMAFTGMASLTTGTAEGDGSVAVYSNSDQTVAFTKLSDSGQVMYLHESDGQVDSNFPVPGGSPASAPSAACSPFTFVSAPGSTISWLPVGSQALTGTTITSTSWDVGATADVTFTTTSPIEIPASAIASAGLISTGPAGYDNRGLPVTPQSLLTGGTLTVWVNGVQDTSWSPDPMFGLTRSGGAVLPAGTTLEFRVQGATMPTTAGTITADIFIIMGTFEEMWSETPPPAASIGGFGTAAPSGVTTCAPTPPPARAGFTFTGSSGTHWNAPMQMTDPTITLSNPLPGEVSSVTFSAVTPVEIRPNTVLSAQWKSVFDDGSGNLQGDWYSHFYDSMTNQYMQPTVRVNGVVDPSWVLDGGSPRNTTGQTIPAGSTISVTFDDFTLPGAGVFYGKLLFYPQTPPYDGPGVSDFSRTPS